MSNQKDDSNHQSWLEFSQSRPNANLYLHQAAAMLHSMDEAFRCSLCHNIFTNPVSVQPCHHAFCNDCIHKALRSDEAPEGVVLRCPYCRVRLDESIDLAQCIVQNRNFEEASRHYKTLRPLLERALQVSNSKPTSAAAAASAAADHTPTRGRASRGAKSERLSVDSTNDEGARSNGQNRKLRNPFIREQFSLEYSESKDTWCFICSHCSQVALRSKNKTWNASILTEHICHKCPATTDEVKQRAAEFTRQKEAPNYSGRYGPYANKKKKRSGDHEEQEKDQEEGAGGDDSSYEPYL